MIGYRLLGPLEVTVDGVPAELGGRRQRALLAILLLHANQPVHRDVLVDQLWGEHPPEAAGHAVNVYIWRLRKALHTAAGTPAVLEALWSHIDHELTDEAPWVPLFNPRSLVMLSSRVGNYQYDPYGAVLIDQLWVTGPSGGPAGQVARDRTTSDAAVSAVQCYRTSRDHLPRCRIRWATAARSTMV